MDSNPEIELILPCTIAVYENNNQTVISLAKPTPILSIISDKNLEKIGSEIELYLIDSVNKSK